MQDMNQIGYTMQFERDGIADLTLRKLATRWEREDQVVTEYRTMPTHSDGKWNAVMFWGTGPGSGNCDLYFCYPMGAVLVLAETPQ